ncbi:MAG: hypothetical protein ABR912_16880 [Terracidiphilus sp.]
MAVVARKMGRVAASTRRIPRAGRQAGAVEFMAGARGIRPLTQFLCVPAAALLLCLSACSAGTVLHGLSNQPEQPQQPEQPAKPAKPTQAAHSTQVAQGAQPANPAHHANKREPKPEPTQQELFEYIRGKLLTLSPADGFNDNLEVTFDPATSILSITQPDGRCDIFVSALDTNSPIWEVMDPGDSYHPRGEILRLTMTSSSGKKARTCYDTENQVDKSISGNRVRLVFAQDKANAVPDFTYNMTKAIKKLVVASGGAAEKKLF